MTVPLIRWRCRRLCLRRNIDVDRLLDFEKDTQDCFVDILAFRQAAIASQGPQRRRGGGAKFAALPFLRVDEISGGGQRPMEPLDIRATVSGLKS